MALCSGCNWLILIPAVDPAQTCVSMCVTVQIVKYETHFLSCSLLKSPFSFPPSSRGQCQLRALPPLTHHLFILTYLSKLIFFTCISDKTLKLYRVAFLREKNPVRLTELKLKLVNVYFETGDPKNLRPTFKSSL